MNLTDEINLLHKRLATLEANVGKRLARVDHEWIILQRHILAIDCFVDHGLKKVRTAIDELDGELEKYRDSILDP